MFDAEQCQWFYKILVKQTFPMDQECELPFDFFTFPEKNEDILSQKNSLSLASFKDRKQISSVVSSSEDEIPEQKVEHYFGLLFSHRGYTESLLKRNMHLQMKCLENSESEPEELYNRRAKRVVSLKDKEAKNWQVLRQIGDQEPCKYRALAKFVKLFGEVKQKIAGIRHDYYSQKSFQTLRKCTPEQILQLTRILQHILHSVMRYEKLPEIDTDKGVDERLIEFLIIPRFFISREKLLKFMGDEKMQENFKMLIYHGCLGHYNNEANKKLPEEAQMKYVRELLAGKDGRQKFKKICTINHGGNFFKKHPDLYYEMYSKNLECLKNIDALCKKKYKSEDLISQLLKNDSKSAEEAEEVKITAKGLDVSEVVNLPLEVCDFKSVSSFLNTYTKQLPDQKGTEVCSLLKSSSIISVSKPNEASKCKVKKFQSLTSNPQEGIKSKLKIKKAFTLELSKEANIILVHPPPTSVHQDQDI